MSEDRKNISQNTDGYDVFISAKSDDLRYAKRVDGFLRGRGLRTFLSETSLPISGSGDYQKVIDSAIEQSAHMVVVASRPEHFSHLWVDYEWRAFAGEMKAGRKPDGNLISVVVGEIDISEIPLGLRTYEVISLDKRGLQALTDYLKPRPEPAYIPETHAQSLPTAQAIPKTPARAGGAPTIRYAGLAAAAVVVLGVMWAILHFSAGRERTLSSRVLTGHVNAVRSLDFSSDSTLLASGSADGTIRLWDPRTGKTLRLLRGGHGEVLSLRLSGDDKWLASGNADGTVVKWDMETGQAKGVMSGHNGTVWSVAFSPDGGTIASAGADASVCLWNAADGSQLKSLSCEQGSVFCAEFLADGILATAGEDSTVKLWVLDSGHSTHTLSGHEGTALALAFQPGGDLLASGSSDGSVHIWDIVPVRARAVLQGHSHWVRAVAFSPDGKVLASGSLDKTIILWSVRSGRKIRTLEGHTDGVFSLAFSPDGRFLASGGDDNTIRIWRL